MLAPKWHDVEVSLERSHVAAHRRLRQGQLFGRFGKALVARSRLEGRQPAKRREVAVALHE